MFYISYCVFTFLAFYVRNVKPLEIGELTLQISMPVILYPKKDTFFCLFQEQILPCFEDCTKSVITCAQRHQERYISFIKCFNSSSPQLLRAAVPSPRCGVHNIVVITVLVPPDIPYQIVIYMNNTACSCAGPNLQSHMQSLCLADVLQ